MSAQLAHDGKWESVETRCAQTATLSFSISRHAQIALSKAVKVKNDITIETDKRSGECNSRRSMFDLQQP
ncbi:hypothetical protein ACO0KY_18535 [Undibacterium sp. Dicai25W]|uniref:hypothetical protein n=1 Tax=Undibacterium sp. Dicai25W TaxID=3413034 RepID=UPI003BF3BE9E